MPTISMFFGILIRMYFPPKGHNPPHIHAYYSNEKATFSIPDGELITGNLAKRQVKLIQAWIEIHQEELMANWELCQNNDEPFKIEPLK